MGSLAFNQIAIVAAGSFAAGYVLFHIVLVLLKRKLRSENKRQHNLVVGEARRKANSIKQDAAQRNEERLQDMAEELENQISDRQQDLETMQADLNSQQQFHDQEEARLRRRKKEIQHLQTKADKCAQEYSNQVESVQGVQREVQQKLAAVAGSEAEKVKNNMRDDQIDTRQLECTKHLKILADELHTSANRLATRVLTTTQARYEPDFVWPKGVNHVEVKDRKLIDQLSADSCQLMNDLRELSEDVTIELVAEKEHVPPVIRLAGGYGMYKEAAKLTLEEVVNRPHNWGKVDTVYQKHRRTLENQALKLGKLALKELQVSGIHIEIIKMVGSLNWRTSYRQNQFYHSLEVAKLAGILATELRVDADAAKRCGLLHDIGKSIDYRIEGSHAVISGDYADRYGEAKDICDTVMSHHADLIVETPLAYVLRAADTLSGARPGARVNLEEGYQDRLSSIQDVVRAFPGVVKVEIMNGAREVHVEVHHKKVQEDDLASLSGAIARKIEENVAFPGQIKVMVARKFESVAVA